ncbi:MAG TPA: TetR/AcrR family transcriptional regulator [Thermoanaerobaculia bacterium]|nr:TetR/AcrR family transcriptional regulator [Thermoanaerobaculia bacterium]
MVQITATPSPEPAPSRADVTRRRILEAASRVFRRQGLHSAGMREIAAELGMHAGNLYYYFRDKGELLAFCQEATLDRLLALAARAESADLPADAKLRLLIAGHVVELNEEVPGSLAHLEIEAIDAERRPAILERRDAYEETWRRILEQGAAGGVFRSVDTGTVSRGLLGAVNWTVKWFRSEGEKTAAEIGDELADVLVGGLLAAGAVRDPGGSRTPRAGGPRNARPKRPAPRAGRRRKV